MLGAGLGALVWWHDDPPSGAGTRDDAGGLGPIFQGGSSTGPGGMAFAGEPGAGGLPAVVGEAGAGGEAGAPAVCCQPLDCGDILGGLECGLNRFSDGCGGTFRCDCSNARLCQDGTCIDCDPGPDPCARDATLCGETRDSCGNAIICPDSCALGDAQASCYAGHCCLPSKSACSLDDCGLMLVGCGQHLDCRDATCPIETSCQPSGKCCKPSNVCTPSDCGYKSDGCGNYLDCGDTCSAGTVCLDNECVDSECHEQDLECGHTRLTRPCSVSSGAGHARKAWDVWTISVYRCASRVAPSLEKCAVLGAPSSDGSAG